jgi:hypothetical protein
LPCSALSIAVFRAAVVAPAMTHSINVIDDNVYNSSHLQTPIMPPVVNRGGGRHTHHNHRQAREQPAPTHHSTGYTAPALASILTRNTYHRMLG